MTTKNKKQKRSLGNILDRIILPLAPGLAARRNHSRMVFAANELRAVALSSYAAAEKHRLTEDWPSRTKSADQAIIPDNPTLNSRARAAVRDEWIADSAVSAYRRNVVGTGITPRAAARDPGTGKELAEFNEKIDRLFYGWFLRAKYYDLERVKNGIEMCGLAIEEFITVGEAFAIKYYVPQRSRVGMVMQMIEPEQLDTSLVKNKDTGNEIRGGVEINEYGAPVAYWIFSKEHPLERFRPKAMRVEADRVLHLHRQRRVRQTRGVTRFAAVLKKMRNLGMYDDYMVVKARLEACLGGIITQTEPGTNTGGLIPGSGDDGKDTYGSDEIIFEPGMHPRLRPGEEWTNLSPQTPGNMYEPFSNHQLGHIGAGCGLDGTTVARDFTRSSYTSLRQSNAENYKEYDPIQSLMIDIWLREQWEEFVTYAILENRISAPGFLTDTEWMAAYLECEWQGPAKPPIDEVKAAAANKVNVDYRFDTRRDILNRAGKDVRDVIRQHGDEQKMAEAEEVYLPDAQAAKPAVAPQEPRPTKKPAAGAKEDDDLASELVTEVLTEAVGEKVAELVMAEE
jgi:lambda family phage portal protein